MGNEIVTVVDNGIVVAGNIVLIIITDAEGGQLAQVVASHVGQFDQVATYLTQEDGAVGQGLQFGENTSHRIDGIDGVVQMFLIGIEHIVGLLFEEIIARGEKEPTPDSPEG